MAVSLRQMEVFLLLMQTRNVTETARLLRISQPAASQQLKELENRLGLTLFVRAGNRISPTGEARALIVDIEQILTRLGRMESRAAELRDATAGSLSIATIATVTGSILPRALAGFHASRRSVELRVNTLLARDVVKSVLEEEDDLGIVYAPVDDHGVAVEPLLRTRMICLLPPDHALASEKLIEARHLTEQTLIVLDPSVPPGMLLHERLPGRRLRTAGVIEVNLSFSALSMVRHRLGLVVTDPVILLSGMAEGLVVRPFEPAIELTLCLVFARNRPLSRTAIHFLPDLSAAIQQAAAQLRETGIPASTF